MGVARVLRGRRLRGVLLSFVSGGEALAQPRGAPSGEHRNLRLPRAYRHGASRVRVGRRRGADD
jgi:hypothetical protein